MREETGASTAPNRLVGTLLVASAPRGARVSVDGIPHGQAPVAIRRLRAGNRLVRVELAGYQRWSWSVYVAPNRQTKVNVELVRLQASPSAASGADTTAMVAVR
jgi:hypothetical protein